MNTRAGQVLMLVLLLAMLVLMLIAAERAVALAQQLLDLPGWLQWVVMALLLGFVAAAIWLGWRWFRPRQRRNRTVAVDRAGIESRIDKLDKLNANTGSLHAEINELDQRRATEQVYVAAFGEISSGKSSLIAALTPAAGSVARDVLGGTTRTVVHRRGSLHGQAVVFADVPGSRESGGEVVEALARDEAVRAHVVLYVCTGDLTRSQQHELQWLGEFGKPMLLVLNKTDQYDDKERDALLQRLRSRTRGIVDAVVAVTAGGIERFQRELGDGGIEQVERQRRSDLGALESTLLRLTSTDSSALEQAREQAVLANLHQRTSGVEQEARTSHALVVVNRYTRRAVVGALAAVVPGSDLIIQGALATAMTRELARLYEINVSDVQIDEFLKHARMTVRTSASIVMAIAGNALKAFPGLGTLGGGVLHAFAYALVFDSLGKALATTLAEHRSLDQEAATDHLKQLLTDASGTRLKHLASVTANALREESREKNL